MSIRVSKHFNMLLRSTDTCVSGRIIQLRILKAWVHQERFIPNNVVSKTMVTKNNTQTRLVSLTKGSKRYARSCELKKAVRKHKRGIMLVRYFSSRTEYLKAIETSKLKLYIRHTSDEDSNRILYRRSSVPKDNLESGLIACLLWLFHGK